MAYCGPRGIPYSLFALGRAWPQPGEPLWLPEDRVHALGWMVDQADVHDACGQHMSDWHDPKTGLVLIDPPFQPVRVKCPAGELLAAHRQEFEESQRDAGKDREQGVVWSWAALDELDDSEVDGGASEPD